jgi:hypothetical protein
MNCQGVKSTKPKIKGNFFVNDPIQKETARRSCNQLRGDFCRFYALYTAQKGQSDANHYQRRKEKQGGFKGQK